MNMNSVRKFAFIVSLFVAFGYIEASCPDNYRQFGTKCLRAFPDAADEATWEEAQAACQADGGAHLAYFNDCTFTNRIIRTYLSTLAPSTNKYWVGASNSGDDNTWIWLDNSEVQMGVPFWGTSTPGWTAEPNGEDADTNYCAVADAEDQFYLHDEDCTLSLNYLCEINSVSSSKTENEEPSENLKKISAKATECPTDFDLISGSCFYFHYNERDDSTKTSFTEAQSICEERDARLATFGSCSLFGDVVAYINEHSSLDLPATASYWVGARDDNTDEYYWIDDSYTSLPSGAPYWGSSNGVPEPNGGENQNCALMYKDDQYYIHDGECFKKAYPLCQLIE